MRSVRHASKYHLFFSAAMLEYPSSDSDEGPPCDEEGVLRPRCNHTNSHKEKEEILFCLLNLILTCT